MMRTETSRTERRFERQFKTLARHFPWADRPLRLVRNPWLWLVRLPLAILLILGGFLAVLPFFGLWMIPLGLLLLAIDVPRLKGPVAAAIIRLRRRVAVWRKRYWR